MPFPARTVTTMRAPGLRPDSCRGPGLRPKADGGKSWTGKEDPEISTFVKGASLCSSEDWNFVNS